MRLPRNIRRFWLWVGIALLIGLAAITLWKRWYWFFPTHAVSEVYTRYADTDGINVVFFKDFKVNDTLFLDVTLLQAKDSAGWATLKTDFSIPDLPPDFQQDIDAGIDLITTKLIPKSPPPPPDTFPNDVLAISSLNWEITVFHVSSNDERHAVMYHNFDNNEHQFTNNNLQ